MKKLTIALLAVCGACVAGLAQAPAGYYNSLNGKAEGELKTAVFNLVRNFRTVSSYSALPEYFRYTDVRPGTTEWWDMYSNIPVDISWRFGAYMNREHSFPKSWWGGSTSTSAYVDLNHLYPSEAKANQAKSNWPLGELADGVAPEFDNGVVRVGTPRTGQGGNSRWVFEPNEEYRGDFARTYFYMVTCYQNLTWSDKYDWMLLHNDYPTLQGWAAQMLLRWSAEDPVSDKERNRNEEVFRIQNNRNPFIDHPELAEYIWGDKRGLAFKVQEGSAPSGDPVLYTPVQDMSLDFNEVALGSEGKAQLYFHGANLRGTLDIVVTGADRAMFGVATHAIPTAQVNSEAGYMLTVTYKPSSLGTHTAKIQVSEGGMMSPSSIGIILRGECLPVPVLTACTALPATDITADSYTANWTSPVGEVVDYWIVNRQIYRGGDVVSEQIEAEAPGCHIDGFGDSDREAYTVQSYRLGYRSPESNVIFVDRAGITGVRLDEPLVVRGFDGMIRFVCSAPHTGVRVYDISGIEVARVGRVEPNDELPLAAGIYLVVTDQCSRPVRVIVR